MSHADDIAAQFPRLARNEMPRSAKKLNMEFDENFKWMTPAEREELLDKLYPEEATTTEETDNVRTT